MNQLKEKREKLADLRSELIALRGHDTLTDEQITRAGEINALVEKLNKDIETLETLERNAKPVAAPVVMATGNGEQREIEKNFRLATFLKEATDGSLTGINREMDSEGRSEFAQSGIAPKGMAIPAVALRSLSNRERRDMTATGGSPAGVEGGYAVQTNVGGLITALSPRLVLAQLGAARFDGLIGNLDLPSFGTQPTAAWETETGAADEVSPAATKISYTPNRLAAFVDVAKQLMIQSSANIEAYLFDFLMRAVATKLEQAALHGNGSGIAGVAGTSGIGSVVGGATGAAPLWDDITGLYKEIAVDNADMGSLAYVTNPLVVNKLQNTPKQSSGVEGNFIMNVPNTLNGFPCAVTTNVASNLEKSTSGAILSAIFFGNWADLGLASWGGLDIMVNPYTKAKDGTVEVILNSYLDANVHRPTSFAAMLDANPA
jgi:HK97 family phage major capsid protein